MTPQAIAYLAALHQIQHTIFELEAGNIDEKIAEDDSAKVARLIPRLHSNWLDSLK